jgi:hypothetical protein
MIAKKNYVEPRHNTTESEQQDLTGAVSITTGDSAQTRFERTETRTMHPLAVDVMTAIQFGNEQMSREGDDANYADDSDVALQDDYAGMMEFLHGDDECWERHPYFQSPNPRGWNEHR